MRKLNKKDPKEFTLARRSFSEGGRQMLDPNTPSINFEQVTKMLGEIQQTHKEVLSNIDSYRIRERIIESTFSARHSQLQSLTPRLDSLNARLNESSTLFCKTQKCSLWERYWIPIAIGITVGAISALLAARWPLRRQAGLLTNLLLMML